MPVDVADHDPDRSSPPPEQPRERDRLLDLHPVAASAEQMRPARPIAMLSPTANSLSALAKSVGPQFATMTLQGAISTSRSARVH